MNDVDIKDFSINLWNGFANLNIELPETEKPGNLLHFQSEVNDVGRVDPITEEFFVLVEDKIKKRPSKPGHRKPPSSDEEGDDVEKPAYLNLPNVVEVYQDDWDHYKFNRDSSLKVIDSGEDGHDFFVNMDNIHLLTEKKANSKIESKLLDARYKYGMVLIGIALLKDYKDSLNDDQVEKDGYDEVSVYDKIAYITKVVSPILLPMISGLGDLQEEEFETSNEND